MSKTKKYEIYGQNKPLNRPRKTRSKTIFQSVDIVLTQGNMFLPTWDGTDHFNFVCSNCHAVADVLSVEFYPTLGEEIGSAIYFHLGCPECGKTGQRKMYLEMGNAPFQRAITHDYKVLIYGREKRKPLKIEQLHR